MRVKLPEDEHPEIGLIALIDCIFFLLIFFMMATSFKHGDKDKQHELPITLPKAHVSFDAATAAPDPLDIAVDGSGRLYLGERRIGIHELHDVLKREATRGKDRPVRISGDKGARYEQIVQVLELCQFEGFTGISMRVSK
jgi:biopolymer transport protein ExbD